MRSCISKSLRYPKPKDKLMLKPCTSRCRLIFISIPTNISDPVALVPRAPQHFSPWPCFWHLGGNLHKRKGLFTREHRSYPSKTALHGLSSCFRCQIALSGYLQLLVKSALDQDFKSHLWFRQPLKSFVKVIKQKSFVLTFPF